MKAHCLGRTLDVPGLIFSRSESQFLPSIFTSASEPMEGRVRPGEETSQLTVWAGCAWVVEVRFRIVTVLVEPLMALGISSLPWRAKFPSPVPWH